MDIPFPTTHITECSVTSPFLIRMVFDRSASVSDGLTSGKGDNSPLKSHYSPIILG